MGDLRILWEIQAYRVGFKHIMGIQLFLGDSSILWGIELFFRGFKNIMGD